jgi:hypothetical protein
MLLFATPLGPPRKDETPGDDPERLVRLVAGARFATDETGRVPVLPYRLVAEPRRSG